MAMYMDIIRRVAFMRAQGITTQSNGVYPILLTYEEWSELVADPTFIITHEVIQLVQLCTIFPTATTWSMIDRYAAAEYFVSGVPEPKKGEGC
jgi:hypothetical protein